VVVGKVDASGHVAEECEVGLNEALFTYVASLKSSMEIYQCRLIGHEPLLVPQYLVNRLEISP
jgi:hypothetical protein